MIVGNNGLEEQAQQKWRDIAPKIIQQARLEATHSVRVAASLKNLEGSYDGKVLYMQLYRCSLSLHIHLSVLHVK